MSEPPPSERPGRRAPPTSSWPRRIWLATWPRRIAALAVALELLYLIAANLFLHSETGMAVMNRRPENVQVAYESAWTPLPGLVRVRALDLGGESRRVRWSTRIDRAWTLISIPSLARKHVRLVTATTVGVDVGVDILPNPDEPEARKSGRGWKVTLGGLRGDDFRRVRINDYELVADGVLRGWIQFQVRGPMTLRIDRLRFEEGVLRRSGTEGEDGEAVAEGLHLDAELVTEPWRVGVETVGELVAGASGDLELGAHVESIGFLDAFLRKLPWLRLGGSGDLALDLRLDRGSLRAGSAMAVQGEELFAELFDFRAHGRGRIAGTVEAREDGIQLAATLAEFAVDRSSDGAAMLVGEGLESIVRISSTALHEPPEDVSGGVTLGSARAEDLSRFGPYFPGGLRLDLERGEAELSMDLTYDTRERSGQGGLEIDLRDVTATYSDARIGASGRIDVELPALDLVGGRFELSGTRLRLENGRIEHRGKPKTEQWSARLTVASGTLDLPSRVESGSDGPREVALDAELAVSMSDSAPVVVLMEQRLPRLRFVDGLLTIPEVELTGRVEARGRRLGLHDVVVSGGRKDQLEILLDLDLDGPSTRGVAYARYRALDAAVVLDDGERDWAIFRPKKKYQEALAEYRAQRARESR